MHRPMFCIPSNNGDHCFPVEASIWNALSYNVTSALTVDSFRHQLNFTLFFKRCFYSYCRSWMV